VVYAYFTCNWCLGAGPEEITENIPHENGIVNAEQQCLLSAALMFNTAFADTAQYRGCHSSV